MVIIISKEKSGAFPVFFLKKTLWYVCVQIDLLLQADAIGDLASQLLRQCRLSLSDTSSDIPSHASNGSSAPASYNFSATTAPALAAGSPSERLAPQPSEHAMLTTEREDQASEQSYLAAGGREQVPFVPWRHLDDQFFFFTNPKGLYFKSRCWKER